MSLYYDRDGRPVSFDEWGVLHEDRDYQRVAYTERDGVAVATVWVGLDARQLDGDGPPLIFQTSVAGGPYDLLCQRWESEADAVTGHAEICKAVFDDPAVVP